MAGKSLAEQGVKSEVVPPYYSVKEAVFPFIKFPGADTILGPEMKSTGEVMGVGLTFAEAFVKSQIASGEELPAPGTGKVFVSVRDEDKPRTIEIARKLASLGFALVATRGTAAALAAAGLNVAPVNKVQEGRPHIVDMIKNGEIAMIVNTTDERRASIQDSYSIRRSALQGRITYYTTIAGARAACVGMRQMRELRAYAVQELHARLLA
jgi:carbamoyl-phosphate synthase large subunit